MRPWMLSPVLATMIGTLVACGDPDPRAASPDPETHTLQEPVRGADAQNRGGGGVGGTEESEWAEDAVRVWFTLGDSLVAVPRPEAGDSLRGALEALLAGPTASERSRGLDSWFGDETRGMLREVRREGGRAVVDFRGSLPSAIPGAGSSAGGRVLLGALDSTVFQFPAIQRVEYRVEGSCDAFWEWLQRECAVATRP